MNWAHHHIALCCVFVLRWWWINANRCSIFSLGHASCSITRGRLPPLRGHRPSEYMRYVLSLLVFLAYNGDCRKRAPIINEATASSWICRELLVCSRKFVVCCIRNSTVIRSVKYKYRSINCCTFHSDPVLRCSSISGIGKRLFDSVHAHRFKTNINVSCLFLDIVQSMPQRHQTRSAYILTTHSVLFACVCLHIRQPSSCAPSPSVTARRACDVRVLPLPLDPWLAHSDVIITTNAVAQTNAPQTPLKIRSHTSIYTRTLAAGHID